MTFDSVLFFVDSKLNMFSSDAILAMRLTDYLLYGQTFFKGPCQLIEYSA